MKSVIGIVNVVAFVLTFVGAVNWGLVGVFDFNAVTMLFGMGTALTTGVYSIVGVAGVYAAVVFFKHVAKCK